MQLEAMQALGCWPLRPCAFGEACCSALTLTLLTLTLLTLTLLALTLLTLALLTLSLLTLTLLTLTLLTLPTRRGWPTRYSYCR